MEEKIKKFLRCTDDEYLKPLFDQYEILSGEEVWVKNKEIYKKTATRISDLNNEILLGLIERIHEMACELGQNLLQGFIGKNKEYSELQGEYNRSFWALTNKENDFKKAEQSLYLDKKRNKHRQWSAFIGEQNIDINQDANKEKFVALLSDELNFDSETIVDFFERDRENDEGVEERVLQLQFIKDGTSQSILTVDKEKKDIVPLYVKPAQIFSIAYNPKTGIVEVACDKQEFRNDLGRLFFSAFFDINIDNVEKMPLREYNLDVLLKQINFQKTIDKKDNIDNIRVSEIELRHYNKKGSLLLRAFSYNNVYAYAKDNFPNDNPFKQSVFVKCAKITIKFKPCADYPKGKVLHLSLTYPNGCNINDQTEKEKLICRKYLPIWNIIKNV